MQHSSIYCVFVSYEFSSLFPFEGDFTPNHQRNGRRKYSPSASRPQRLRYRRFSVTSAVFRPNRSQLTTDALSRNSRDCRANANSSDSAARIELGSPLGPQPTRSRRPLGGSATGSRPTLSHAERWTRGRPSLPPSLNSWTSRAEFVATSSSTRPPSRSFQQTRNAISTSASTKYTNTDQVWTRFTIVFFHRCI